MKSKFLFFALLLMVSSMVSAQNRSDSIHITHYTLNLDVTDFSTRQISGNAELQIVSKMEGISIVNLDLQGFVVDSVLLDQQNIPFQYQSPLLSIPVSNFAADDTLEVSVYYHGVPATDPQWGGFYFSGGYAYNMGVGMSVVPHSFGRAWYPCIDEFTDKSTYTYNIRTQEDMMVVCGGVLVDSTFASDGTCVWTWQLTHPIPTYLSSVAVANYQCYRDTVQGIDRVVPIEIYAESSKISSIPGTFQHLKTIFRALEQKFGAYPWQRVGYVLVPFMGGAMEHATNITFPNFAVDGTLNYESLVYHEFSHAWFGNYITCAEAETMWINEGFASYCELISDEVLDPTRERFYENLLALHRSVLKNAHNDDGGFYALDNVPLDYTYGTTSYDKGSLVAHSLRGYMGDELFFSSLKTLFEQNPFSYMDSELFFQKLSQISGIDLTDFYLGWVHQPGFLHFSVDSIVAISGNQYRVHLRQRLYEAHNFANSNRLDLQFVSAAGDSFIAENVQFSGENGVVELDLPFAPVYVVVDPQSKYADAIIDYERELEVPTSWNCTDAACRVTLTAGSTPMRVRVERNLVSPDPLKVENEQIVRISPNHYWRVEFIPTDNLQGNLRFNYNAVNATMLDYELLQGYNKNHLLLLYRRNPQSDWQIIPRTLSGSNSTGTVTSHWLLPGEYTLAISETEVDIVENDEISKVIVYPNPTNDFICCQISSINEIDRKGVSIEIIDSLGKMVKRFKMKDVKEVLSISELVPGTYFLQVKSGKKSLKSVSFIKK